MAKVFLLAACLLILAVVQSANSAAVEIGVSSGVEIGVVSGDIDHWEFKYDHPEFFGAMIAFKKAASHLCKIFKNEKVERNEEASLADVDAKHRALLAIVEKMKTQGSKIFGTLTEALLNAIEREVKRLNTLADANKKILFLAKYDEFVDYFVFNPDGAQTTEHMLSTGGGPFAPAISKERAEAYEAISHFGSQVSSFDFDIRREGNHSRRDWLKDQLVEFYEGMVRNLDSHHAKKPDHHVLGESSRLLIDSMKRNGIAMIDLAEEIIKKDEIDEEEIEKEEANGKANPSKANPKYIRRDDGKILNYYVPAVLGYDGIDWARLHLQFAKKMLFYPAFFAKAHYQN